MYYNEKYGIEINRFKNQIEIKNRVHSKNRYNYNKYTIKRVKDKLYRISPLTYPMFVKHSDARIAHFNQCQSSDSIKVYVYLPNYNNKCIIKIHCETNIYECECNFKVGIINIPKSITEFTIEIAPITYLPGIIENQYVGILYCSYNYSIKGNDNVVMFVFDTISPSYFYDIWINNEFIMIDKDYLIWRNFKFIKQCAYEDKYFCV